jgi:hypothetical protein
MVGLRIVMDLNTEVSSDSSMMRSFHKVHDIIQVRFLEHREFYLHSIADTNEIANFYNLVQDHM